MTFDDLKGCIPGETVIIDQDGDKSLYQGLTSKKNRVIVEYVDSSCRSYIETDMVDWTIKQPKRKLHAYRRHGHVIHLTDDSRHRVTVSGSWYQRDSDYDLEFE